MRTVKLEGFRELDASLRELTSRATAKNVARRALKKAAEPIDDMASRLAPRLTGRLSVSVITGTQLTPSQRRGINRNSVEVYVGTVLSRGRYNEFGTINMAANPFMRPAWDAKQDEALLIIRHELAVEIEKAAQRAARKAIKLAS